MMPRISVVMPVFNSELYVKDAVCSILDQTTGDFEFLITDDGSTDNSLAILKHFAARDSRIRLVSRPNTGYVRALNEMLPHARGEFTARMDADDIALPDRFQIQIDRLLADKTLVAVGSSISVIDPDGDHLINFQKPESHSSIDSIHLSGPDGAAITHPTVMFRTSALQQVGGYRQEYWPAEDADLFLRLAEIGTLANISKPLLLYRMHIQSVSHIARERQLDALRRASIDAAIRRGLPLPATSDPKKPFHAETQAQLHIKWSFWALGSRKVSTARKHALRALSLAPSSRMAWVALFCALRGR